MTIKLTLRFLLLIFLYFFSLASFASSPESVFELINKRLSFMQDVALYKALNHLPIEDLEREKLVMKSSISAAKQSGLEAKSTADFFSSQILAAKAIQYRYRAELLSEGNLAKRPVPDLKNDIRPQLIQVGQDLLVEIKQLLSSGVDLSEEHRQAFYKRVNVDYLTEKEKALVFDSLRHIRLEVVHAH